MPLWARAAELAGSQTAGPEVAASVATRVWYELMAGGLAGAEATARRVQATKDADPLLLVRLADSLLIQGRRTEGLTRLRELLRSGPDAMIERRAAVRDDLGWITRRCPERAPELDEVSRKLRLAPHD